jgi:hypothetical protein
MLPGKIKGDVGFMFIAASIQVCGEIRIQTTVATKRALPAAFIFNLPAQTRLTLPCLHVTSPGSSFIDYECSFTFPLLSLY